MRIISQDRMLDFNYNEATLEIINNKAIIANGINIGTYKSKDRVIEIMKEIRNNYIFSQSILDNNGELSTLIDTCQTKESIINALKKIYYYEMPKE